MESVDVGLPRNSKFRHFHTAETLPDEWFHRYSGTVLEVNAGMFPFGVIAAKKHPQMAVVSQDIATPSKNKIKKWTHQQGLQAYPDNFIYYMGDAQVLLPKNIKAIISLYPSNLEETLHWLPQVVEMGIAVNPNIYIAIVTEIITGKLREGLGSYNLADTLMKTWKLDGKAQKTIMSLDEAERVFTITEYSTHLRRLAREAALIEVNSQRRKDFT